MVPFWALLPQKQLPGSKRINSYDFDGVIYMGESLLGVSPGLSDVIITGRSYEESSFVGQVLRSRGIRNRVFYNPTPLSRRTRISSGRHKAKTLYSLLEQGYDIGIHFEDDPVQKEIIEAFVPTIRIVHFVHELTEK